MARMHRVIDDGPPLLRGAAGQERRALGARARALPRRRARGRATRTARRSCAVSPPCWRRGAPVDRADPRPRGPSLPDERRPAAHDRPAGLASSSGAPGPIACEFAQALNRLGVEVTMVLRGDAPLRGEEPEARETLLRVLRHEGVRVVTGAREIGARDVPGGTELRGRAAARPPRRCSSPPGASPALDESDPAEAGVALRGRRGARRRAPRDDGERRLGPRRRHRRRPPPLPVHARRDPRGPAGRRERAAQRPSRAGLRRDAARHFHAIPRSPRSV